MQLSVYISRYRTTLEDFYRWRDSTETAYRMMLALAFACLTGAGAYLRVYTPFTPVPFTAQVLVVLLSGAVLGSRWGGASQLLYITLGIVGMPWFAGGASGPGYVVGATGGYLAGFVMAAYLVGHLVDRDAAGRTLPRLLPAMLAGVLVIYAAGATWLAISLELGPGEAIVLGVAPFILLDIGKALLAAGVGRLVTVR